MFTYPDVPWQRYWLITLLALWAVLLFGGFIFGRGNTTRRMPTWTRITSSLVLVIVAWSWVTFTLETEVATFALLIALGMSLGFVGDLFMAGLLPGGRFVIGGMGTFGLGHVFYIIAILTISSQLGLDEAVPRWSALLVWQIIGALAWTFVVFRGQKATTLHWAALPYALLLAGTAGFATGLALQAVAFVPLATGAVLFLLSDLILAAELFNNARFPFIGDVVWLTYGPAQALIVYAVGAALFMHF